MSRQAQISTKIVVKDHSTLKDAVAQTASELQGVEVSGIGYYNGQVLGIKCGRFEAGVIVGKDGSMTLVGEDIHLHSELGRRLKALLEKNYSSFAVGKALRSSGFQFSVRKTATANIFSGTRR